MSQDLRRLIEARRQLSYAEPLSSGDPRYVERADELAIKLRSRIEEANVRQLLLTGPTGCGKSTELLSVARMVSTSRDVIYCPYDRDVGARIDQSTFFSYLLWRTAQGAWDQLPPESRNEIEVVFGPHDGWTDSYPERVLSGELQVPDVLIRAVRALGRVRPVLLIIDGLEKLPGTVSSAAIGDLLRARVFNHCQSLLVVPARLRFGWSALQRSHEMLGVEILPIKIPAESTSMRFVFMVLRLRAFHVVGLDTTFFLAQMSGGLVRDAIQLAADACQIALDAREETVAQAHAEQAVKLMREGLELVLSDDPERAWKFLAQVHRNGELPANAAMRDLSLSLNLILEGADGRFRVHPLLVERLA